MLPTYSASEPNRHNSSDLQGVSKVDLLEDLYRRYGADGGRTFGMKLRYFRKKYLWKVVVYSSKLLKRLLDIAVAATALILLSPLFILIALLVRLNDGGAVLFWQSRVGPWAGSFRSRSFAQWSGMPKL